MARLVRLSARYLSGIRNCGVRPRSSASRDVQRVVHELASAVVPLEGDLHSFVPETENNAIRVLAHGRRVPTRNLWVWYWATDQELTLVAIANVPPVAL